MGPSDEGNDRLKQQFSSNSLAILTSVDDWEMFGDKNKLEMVLYQMIDTLNVNCVIFQTKASLWILLIN